MGKVLKCDLCEKPATVHLTQIVNNKIHKVDLCEKCAQEKGVTDPNGFSLADLLVQGPGTESTPEIEGISCPTCGHTQKNFQKTGRFGCPDCYQAFQPLLEPLLKNMHKGITHKGKVPVRALERKTILEKMDQLQRDLDKAVQQEAYEEAAGYRDKINELKKNFASVT